MKTLVIHPSDKSTDFLKPIYANIPDATVITSGTVEQVGQEIINHDRIIMMGHGSPFGLFSVGKFKNGTHKYYPAYVINSVTVPLLQEKENIFIWCNADQFVIKNKLKGFYSGMFISEVAEAKYCGLPGTTQDIVDESNDTFAKLVGSVINKPIKEIYEYTHHYYGILAESNPVTFYNHNRLYLNS